MSLSDSRVRTGFMYTKWAHCRVITTSGFWESYIWTEMHPYPGFGYQGIEHTFTGTPVCLLYGISSAWELLLGISKVLRRGGLVK